MIIIGVDCATQKKNTGLTMAIYEDGICCLKESRTAVGEASVAGIITEWLAGRESFLLAMDAPLGWPAELGERLHAHKAGECLPGEPNHLFRRMTDRFVKDTIGKTPLDVGADRIARTAHAALSVVEELRGLTGLEIGMGWSPKKTDAASAIEVYPAATLKSYGIVCSGYKGRGKEGIRGQMLEQLKRHMTIESSLEEAMIVNDDVLDSGLCVLAGMDFLRGQVHMPIDTKRVRKEGWIWFRKA